MTISYTALLIRQCITYTAMYHLYDTADKDTLPYFKKASNCFEVIAHTSCVEIIQLKFLRKLIKLINMQKHVTPLIKYFVC